MKNPLETNNDVSLLYPAFGGAILRAIATANAYSKGKYAGFHEWRVLEGYRSPARQLELYAQGRTKPGNIVTYNKVSNYHSVGLAVDVVPFDEHGKVMWNAPAALWQIWGHCVRAEGLIYGGDWKMKDMPHAQCTLIQRAKWLSPSRKYLRDLGYATA